MKAQEPVSKLLCYLLELMTTDPAEFARIMLAASFNNGQEHDCTSEQTAKVLLEAAAITLERKMPGHLNLASVYWRQASWFEDEEKHGEALHRFCEFYRANWTGDVDTIGLCYALQNLAEKHGEYAYVNAVLAELLQFWDTHPLERIFWMDLDETVNAMRHKLSQANRKMIRKLKASDDKREAAIKARDNLAIMAGEVAGWVKGITLRDDGSFQIETPETSGIYRARRVDARLDLGAYDLWQNWPESESSFAEFKAKVPDLSFVLWRDGAHRYLSQLEYREHVVAPEIVLRAADNKRYRNIRGADVVYILEYVGPVAQNESAA